MTMADDQDCDLEHLRTITLQEATKLFGGDQEAAIRWLDTPRSIFNYTKPKDMLDTPEGIERVRTLIQQLAHGVFP